MSEPLFEIENWRGGWYYKLGSRYTGPFERRDAAVTAAKEEIDPLLAPESLSLRASLSERAPRQVAVSRNGAVRYRGSMMFGMSFRIPGTGDHA
jgi:hypothetical protein